MSHQPLVKRSLTHIVRDSHYVLRRELPAPGEVQVRPGERVHATQPIGQCRMPGESERFRLDSVLGVRASHIDRYLEKDRGDSIRINETLASRRFFGKRRVFRSPIDGYLDQIHLDTGEVEIRRQSINYSLEAGFEGTVESTDGERHIDIRIGADLLSGLIGIGLPAMGTVEIVTEPQEPLRAKHIDGGCCDHIIVSGADIDYPTVKRAMALGVRGIVAASMPAREFADYVERECEGSLDGPRSRAISLILTEGFGQLVMREQSWQFLERLKGELVLLDDSFSGQPAVIYPNGSLPDLQQVSPLPGWQTVQPGDSVRIVAGTHFGQTARVKEARLREASTAPEDSMQLLKLELAGGEIVSMPRWNLEIMELS